MTNTSSFIIKGAKVLEEDHRIEQGYIQVDHGNITAIGEERDLTPANTIPTYSFPENYTVIPGMIDVHIHGANGADTMDATIDALDTIASTLPKEGTTSFLATTMTQSREAIEKALRNVANHLEHGPRDGNAEILGVHLEGPFISKEKAGAQPLEHIIAPDVSLFDHFQNLANQHIKLVTLAPEEDMNLSLTNHLHKQGIIASIGHSQASYNQVDAAITAGATHVTHLYNVMSGLHHREPGVVGAALLRKELMAELIVDGIHSRPEMVRLAVQQIGKDRLILITDAMRAKCLKNGIYDLGGQKVIVEDGKAQLESGALAGSVLKMGDAFKNILQFTDAHLEDVVDMTATNPAKELGVFDRKGSIAIGKDADLVVLNEHHEIVMTFCRGMLSYQKEA